jgi:hypothetical protein
MKKIHGYKTHLNKRLDGRWEWRCAVWFSPFGLWADAVVKNVNPFNTEQVCVENMAVIMKSLGITKKTYKTL